MDFPRMVYSSAGYALVETAAEFALLGDEWQAEPVPGAPLVPVWVDFDALAHGAGEAPAVKPKKERK